MSGTHSTSSGPLDPRGTGAPDAAEERHLAERRQRKRLLAIVAILAVAVVVLIVLLVVRDDDATPGASPSPSPTATETGSPTETPSPSEAPSPSDTPSPSEAPSPSETAASPGPSLTDEEAATVVWPDPGPGSPFTDPEAAARAFAEDLIGFTGPVLGEFQAGDSRSGEVEVRAQADGPVSTVMVRQMSDERWYVIAAATEQIDVTLPEPGSTVDNPLRVEGRAQAFEGNVRVTVYAWGSADPLGEGSVTGSGDGTMGPFSGEIAWDDPGVGGGFVLFAIDSARDGSPWQVAALPLNFGAS